LDPEAWYVHAAEPLCGDFKLVRGLPPAAADVPEPNDGVADPALDSEFQSFIQGLEGTGRHAFIKVRVNQGVFRERLLTRWGSDVR
jgi:hypothetical protein